MEKSMTVPYYIDLKKYSLQKFKENLSSREMIPSRKILKEDIDARFDALEQAGIANLKELTSALKTKSEIEEFSNRTGLSTQYLTVIGREARSYLPSPIRLDTFPNTQESTLEKLEAVGIKNTRHLFTAAQERTARKSLAEKAGVPIESLNELVGLSDLARLYGVGPVFARMIYDVGIHSIKEFIQYTAQDFIDIYEEQTQQKADFGVADIEFSLHLGKILDIAADI